uniref:Peptidase M48 domain-containing protein n=1 Tax=Lygus hesperus TaxID=30085 RepID=A0A0A9YCV7_LYGHE
MIIFGPPMRLCIPPTAMALDQHSLYQAIVTCFDGKEQNFIMDLRDLHVRNTMLYLQYWSDRRLRFVLGHELSHIAHGDMGVLKGFRNNILQRLGTFAILRCSTHI